MPVSLDSTAARLEAALSEWATEASGLEGLAARGLLAIDAPPDAGGFGGGIAELISGLTFLASRAPGLASAVALAHMFPSSTARAELPLLLEPPTVSPRSLLSAAGSVFTGVTARAWGPAAAPRLCVAAEDGTVRFIDAAEPGVHVAPRPGEPFPWAASVRLDEVPSGAALPAPGMVSRFRLVTAAQAVAFGGAALALCDEVAKHTTGVAGVDDMREARLTDLATRVAAARALVCQLAHSVADDDALGPAALEALSFAGEMASEVTLSAAVGMGGLDASRCEAAFALHLEACRQRSVLAPPDHVHAALSQLLGNGVLR